MHRNTRNDFSDMMTTLCKHSSERQPKGYITAAGWHHLRAIAEGDNTQCTGRHHSCLPLRDLFSTNEIKCLILKDNNSHNEPGQQVVPHLSKSHTREWVYWTCLVIHMKMSSSACYYVENLNLKLSRRILEGSFLKALSIFKEWVTFFLFKRFFPALRFIPRDQEQKTLIP